MVIQQKLLWRVLGEKQRKESPMDHGQLSMVADKFQGGFSEALLNGGGKAVQVCRRQRVITPLRLGLALTATGASQRVETSAAFHGGFQALVGPTVPSNAFSHHVAKPHVADGARTMAARLIRDRTLKVLGFEQGRALGALRPLVRQDGSALAMHDGLRAVLPGRCKAIKPAAVDLHTTMDLRCDAPPTGVLTPDTTSAQALLPAPPALRDRVVLADRGDGDVPSLRRGQDEGGFVLLRAKAGMNPQGLEAFREDGNRWRSLRNTSLQTIHAPRPQRQRVERGVQWPRDGHPLCRRRLLSGNPRTKRFGSFLTHLPATRYPLEGSCRAYQGRGQGACRLQAWQSSANLPAFDTAKPALVEGWRWAAIAAAARKRFVAHRPPLLMAVPLATRKVALGALPVLGDLVEAWKPGDVVGLSTALVAAITSLACHARRAHPERDR